MKKVQYIYEFQTESFSLTLEGALNTLEANGSKIVSVHILFDTQALNGFTHSAYIIYEPVHPEAQ